MLGIVVGLLVFVLLLGAYHPRSGADVLNWQPTRSPELEAQNEVDDLEQMLEAANRRRRARGDAELTEETVQAKVREHQRESIEYRERYLAAEGRDDEDLLELLEMSNARRRKRGEPELTADEYKAMLDAESGVGGAGS